MDLQEKHNVKIQFSCKEGLAYENFSYTVLEKKDDRFAKPGYEPRERAAESFVTDFSGSQVPADRAQLSTPERDESMPPIPGALTEFAPATEIPSARPPHTRHPKGRRRPRRTGRTGRTGRPVAPDGILPQPGSEPEKAPKSPGSRRGMRGRGGRRWRPKGPIAPQPSGGASEGFQNPDTSPEPSAPSFDRVSPSSGMESQPAPVREE